MISRGSALLLVGCAGPVDYTCSVTWDAGATSEPWGDGSMSCGVFREQGVTVLQIEETACEEASGPRDGIDASCRCVLGDRNGCEAQ